MSRTFISSPLAGLMATAAMLVTSAPAYAQGFGSRIAADAEAVRSGNRPEARSDYQRRDRDSSRDRASSSQRNPDRQRTSSQDRRRSDSRSQSSRNDDRRWSDNRRSNDNRSWDNNRRDNNNDRNWNNNNRGTNNDRRYNDNRRDGNDRYGNSRYDNDRRYDNNNRWNNNRRPATGWSSNWRNDRNYDWRGYRDYNRDHYRMSRYYSPYRNSGYSRFRVGLSINRGYYGSRYWINDPWSYRLPAVPRHMRWVRYYDDVVLVDMRTGRVRDVIYNFFW